MKYEVPETVPEAAKLMDEISPGWANKINLETFDVGDATRCVIGQTLCNGEPGYTKKLKELFGNGSVCVFANDEEEWREEILLRRNTGTWTWACKMLAEGKKVKRDDWDKQSYWYLDGKIVYYNIGTEIDKAPLHVDNFRATNWIIYEPKPTLKNVKQGQKFYFVSDLNKNYKNVYQKAQNGYIEVVDMKGRETLKIVGHDFPNSVDVEIKIVD